MVLVVLHVLAAGIWLGCLATEIAFEKAMAADVSVRDWVSALHDRVDRWIEGPAFVVVAVTGLALSGGDGVTGWTLAHALVGAIAVAANVWCLAVVFSRARASNDGDVEAWFRADRMQHRLGTIVTVAMVAALVLAFARLTIG